MFAKHFQQNFGKTLEKLWKNFAEALWSKTLVKTFLAKILIAETSESQPLCHTPPYGALAILRQF